MLTYQDYEKVKDDTKAKKDFVAKLIRQHKGSKEVQTALIADEYDAQRNTTISEYAKVLYTASGRAVKDFTAANTRIASNFFHTMNTRRCVYSLGNGVEFPNDRIKQKLGMDFDTRLKEAALAALIHGRAYLFFNKDRVHVFKTTEFAPLVDEYTGDLRAGVRYWQLESDRPMNVVLYEEDGYTALRMKRGREMEEVKPKRAYMQQVQKAPADAEWEIVGEQNYNALPIVTLWGSSLHQSTLVGLRGAIDAYDLIQSGFANDLQECAQIYWILENYGGMKDDELMQFRDRLKLQHIAVADTTDEGKIVPYTQDVPHTARTAFLQNIRAQMYEDFGLLDLRTLSAAATNDHIMAGYQAQDDMADDFEYQIIDAVNQLLALIGEEETPEFKRGKIANLRESVEMLVMESGIVDIPDDVLIKAFPNFTPEMVEEAIDGMVQQQATRVQRKPETNGDA